MKLGPLDKAMRDEASAGTLPVSVKKIIEVENLRRDFQVGEETVHALRGISFDIREGEFVTIMGSSGSGKSTLLNILGCLDTPTSGEYRLDGIPVRSMDKDRRAEIRNRKIGFVFQSYNLLPKTTALENVELPLLYNPAVKAEERRRRSLARALVNDPVLILADEATGNLDTRTSYEILSLFQELHHAGRTIVFVTHNPELARFSSRNIVLRDGHVIQDAPNRDLRSAKDALLALPKEDD